MLDLAGERGDAGGGERRFPRLFHSPDQPPELNTQEEIDQFSSLQDALSQQAKRRSLEIQVQLLRFELIAYVVLLALAAAIGISVTVGSLGDPGVLRASLVASSAWGAIAATFIRVLRHRR